MINESLINGILGKKEWTGEDLGKLCLFSLVCKYNKQEFPISQYDVDHMALTLEGDLLYTGQYYYLGTLTKFLDVEHHALDVCLHMMLHGHFRFTEQLRVFNAYQKQVNKLNDVPLVLAPGEFDAYKRKALELLGATPLSISDLIFNSLEIIITEKFETSQDEAPALAVALRKAQGKECANNRFIELYKRVYQHGFYVFKDGASKDNTVCEYAVKGKLLFKGVKTIRKKAKEYDLTDYSDQNIIDALENKPITKELGFIINDVVTKECQDVTWGNCVNFIIDVNDLLMLYVDEYKKNKVRAISYLKADFAELYQALLTHVCNAIGAPGDDLFTKITNKKEVAKTQIVGSVLYMLLSDADVFKVLYDNEPSDQFYSMCQRAKSGIICTQNKQNSVDFESAFNKALELPDLSSVFIEQEQGNINKDVYNELIHKPLIRLYRYRALLEVLEKQLNIPHLFESVKNNIEPVLSMADNFNELLYITYFNVAGSHNTVKETRKIIKERFKEIDYHKYEFKKAKIAKAIKAHRAFLSHWENMRITRINFYSILE